MTTGYFDITFYDIGVYQGSFINPPINTSLDVKENNQFITNFEQGRNQYYSINHSDNKQHWLRVAKLQGKATSNSISSSTAANMAFWKGYILRPWQHYDVLVVSHIYCGILWTIESTRNKAFGYFIKGYRSVNKIAANYNYLSKFRLAKDTTDGIDTDSTHPSVYLEALCPTSSSGNQYYMVPEIGLCEDERTTWGQISSKSFVSNIAQRTYDIIGDNDTIIGEEYTPEALGSQITWPF